MDENCIFCKIISGDIPSEKVYENDYVYAFRDIHPEAKVHVLVVPKVHIASMNDVSEENSKYISEIYLAIKEIAKQEGIAKDGYRVISNCGKDAGQTVFHLHFHILGGQHLGEKLIKM